MEKNNNIGIDFIGRLSGGNHELFHSNLLAFLAEHEPEYFRKIFQCGFYDNTNVGREDNHLDLCLYNKEGKKVFILENKMKSMPSRSQLQRYAKSNKNQVAEDCKYVLLTLIDPVWECSEDDLKKWEIFSYKKLIKNMRDHLKDTQFKSPSYLTCFFNDYLNYVDEVVSMANDAKGLLDSAEFQHFTIENYCNYGSKLTQPWQKNLSKKLISQACLQYLLKHIDDTDLICQTLYDHGQAGFEILVPLYPKKHSDENPSDMFFIHLQGKSLNRGFRIYTTSGRPHKGTKKSKTNSGVTLRGEFLNKLWNENMEDPIAKKINDEFKQFKIHLDAYDKSERYAYIFDKFVMPYVNTEGVNENTLLKDVLHQMKSEIETVLKICKN